MAEPNIAEETLAYRNPLDGTEPLYAFVTYPRLDRPLPLLVVMHGYSQGADRTTVADVVRRFARRYGIIAASLDLRGRGGSAGRRDSSGRETSDIRAACEFLMAHLGYRLDSENLAILGYSGGGGNVFSVLVKCPDLFRSAFSFFGVSDYGYWFDHGAEERHRAQLVEDVGGSPTESPEAYAARNSLLGVGNNRQTDIHLFWDAEEKVCPPYLNLAYAERARALGFDNVILHESRPGEQLRWLHGYPAESRGPQAPERSETSRSDLVAVEPFVADCLEDPHVPPVVLDPVGRLTVVGYVITKPFVVLAGSLTDCVLDLTYSIAGEAWRFLVGAQTAPQTARATVILNRWPQGARAPGPRRAAALPPPPRVMVRARGAPEEAEWPKVRLEETRLVIEDMPVDVEVVVTPQ
jgi:pimeloyl-ACP methyl ester carboxylesterase